MDKNKKITITFFVVVLFFTVFTAYYSHADSFPPEEDIADKEKEEKEQERDKESTEKDKEKAAEEKEKEEEKSKADHGFEFKYPDAVRGIYLTGHSAGGNRLETLLDLVDSTDLNSMVIDIKDDTGNITYKLEGTPYDEYSKNYISDPEGLLETLEEHEIYPIARIVVFKDSVYAPDNPELSFRRSDGSIWRNNRGEAYVSPFKKEIWEYNLEIAKKAAEMGFQDIQFDYVRFPEGFENREDSLDYSFGEYSEDSLMPRIHENWEEETKQIEEKMKEAEEVIEDEVEVEEDNNNNNDNDNSESKKDNKTDAKEKDDGDKEIENEEKEEEPEKPEYSYGLARTQAITDFVEYAYQELEPYDVDVSVDIFGYTAVDMDAHGIGQNFLDISRNVDVISSMIYPSHWGPGYFGIPTPDTEPYRLTKEYVVRENKILEQLEDPPISRPWIQDFTATWLGAGNYISYGKEEVEAQIRALNEHGVEEFLIWDSNNNYSEGVDYTPLSNN